MKARLDLLQQANVITEQAYLGCLRALEVIDRQLSLDHESEQYQMAITHLARAADRIWQNEPVEEGLDQDVLDEIEADECYPQVLKLHQQIVASMGIETLPASEESFLLANVYSLIQVSLEDQPL
ncbi:hypothetical protein H2O73_02305 [Vibrio sp. 404]|uniref:PRD domain-containing protein n=1 Tax=Vibrio marinisediminis TaxID=2758441 RepID=A0A7W2FN44_9VIBR|nr:hypothetical protein [Vibrio marinisediminis]MBA5761161.1 hypothetical protein [Vibrio marinisediminis]